MSGPGLMVFILGGRAAKSPRLTSMLSCTFQSALIWKSRWGASPGEKGRSEATSRHCPTEMELVLAVSAKKKKKGTLFCTGRWQNFQLALIGKSWSVGLFSFLPQSPEVCGCPGILSLSSCVSPWGLGDCGGVFPITGAAGGPVTAPDTPFTPPRR